MSERRDLAALLKELKKVQPELCAEFESCLESQGEVRPELDQRLDQQRKEISGLRAELKHSEKMRNELVSICAHDLKSPVNTVISFVEILKSGGLRPQEIENIYDRLDRSARHMWALVHDILDTSHLESGQINLQTEPLLLSNLCKEALEQASEGLSQKDIQSQMLVEPGELKVNFDHKKGLQILANLLGNAIKFTPRGGNVDIRVQSSPHRTRVEVKDSGQGIPAPELSAIFEKFKQTSTRSTEGEKGSGLGLSIVKQLVDLHKGTVEVESEVGKGTAFIIEFPVAESPKLLKLFRGK